MTAVVEASEVQGNVLYAYGARFSPARYIRLALDPDKAAAGAEVLAGWVPAITFGRRPKEVDVRPHLNLALTYRGLGALGAPAELLHSFPEDFREGAVRRAPRLGDRWTPDPEFGEADVMLMIHARTEGSRDAFAARLLAANDRVRRPFTVVRDRSAGVAGGHDREPFGFSDGRSQPAVEGFDADPVGDGVYAGCTPTGGPLRRHAGLLLEDLGLKPIARRWRLIRTGEFLLGYDNEDGVHPKGPPAPLGPNGTFMVYREMPQDVDGFKAYVDQSAARLGMDSKALSAKIVGRRTDGTSLVVPAADDGEMPSDRRRANHFLYAEDPSGVRCPHASHVRRANPRDSLPGGGERTVRHRIIRRGSAYEDLSRDGRTLGQGLVFVCFGASIAKGFEFIQEFWINGGGELGIGVDADFLLQQPGKDGAPTGRMVIPGFRYLVLEPPAKPFVSVVGCEYLFVPSRRACEWLARLGGRRARPPFSPPGWGWS